MFKKIIVSVVMCAMTFGVSAATLLERGTLVSVRTTEEIRSNGNGVDNGSMAVVDSDVKKGGVVLIKSGTPVLLQIEKKKAKGCGKAGFVNVKCLSTTTVDGQKVVLEGGTRVEGDMKKGLSVGLGVGLGLTFLPGVGFAFLAIKGEQAVVPANTLMPTVYVMNECSVGE